MSLYKSKSQIKINITSTNPELHKIKISQITPKIMNSKIRSQYNQSNSLINSLSFRKTKYSNDFIFMKREIVFNKSLEQKKATFKYQNYILFDKTKKKIYKRLNKNSLKKRSSSFFLTGGFLKENNSMFPFILNENSNIIELNNKENKKDYLGKVKNKTNIIFNNYNNFMNRKERINLKLINNNYLLKTFDKKIRNEKELENKTCIEKKNDNIILRKQMIYDNCKKKELSKIKYIDNIKDYLNYKMNLNIKKEKSKVIKENYKDEIDFFDDKIKTINNNFNSFNNTFFLTLDKYSKQLFNKTKKEKEKDRQLIMIINTLKQQIINLKSKIHKIKNNYDDLNKYLYIFLCIKEKKLELPNYYKIIIENKMDEKKDELKKINKSEIERILRFKKNISDLDPDYLFAQIRKYENDEIDLIKRYNSLRKEIFILKNEKEELKNNIIKSEKDASHDIIESKKNILLNLKKKNNELKKTKQSLFSYLYKNEEDEDKNIANNQLYYKTNKIINNLNKFVKYDFGISKKIIRGNKENKLILYNLSNLEILIYIILNKIAEFKKKFPNKLNDFHQLLEKNKRIRKALELKNMKELKLKFENQRINEKNEKVIFIPVHKIYDNNMIAKHINLRKNKVKREFKVENIYDYLSE